VNAFLSAKRAERGKQTAANYRARLRPVLNFADRAEQLKQWPLAVDIDAEFVTALKSFLMTYQTSRNGRKAAPQRSLSGTQVRNALETLRCVINWATDPMVAKLPPHMPNPLVRKVIPAKAGKNPLRELAVQLDLRCQIVSHMDAWQLCQLAWSLVLPLRPDEAAGLLITDVNTEKGWLEFGYRFADFNFTKEKTTFVLPYPPEFVPILGACIQARGAGPLLRSRRAFGKPTQDESITDDDLLQSYEAAVQEAGTGMVQAEHDRKQVFRRVLKERWGGVSEDRLAFEFKQLVQKVTGRANVKFYDLRHAATQGMKDAKLPHLELRYLTGHKCDDILNVYTSVQPVEAMMQYFATIRPLIDAIVARSSELGLRAG
jgi:integrase